MKLYLKAPASFWESTRQVREAICNGAGPRNFGWAIPDTFYGLSIKDAADIHDWMYWKGATEKDKQDADSDFLTNMLRIINTETTTFPLVGFLLKLLRHRRALKYYEAVHEFGHKAFWGSQFSEDGR